MSNPNVDEKSKKTFLRDAKLIKKKGLNILNLKGSDYEIGYQHGKLLQKEIKDGAVEFYADPVYGGTKKHSIAKSLIYTILNRKVYSPIRKAQPKEIIEQLRGISDGSGVPFKTIFRANHHTAVNMVMTPIIIKNQLKSFNKLGIKVGACSTFVATKDVTQNGKTIVGRNTDYPGIDKWPQYQTVAFVEPEEGFKYVQMGSAGMILWAPGMNEKSIVVCAHYMIYNDINPRGWSIPAFTDKCLRYAENLDDAIDIFKKEAKGVSCGFVITDGKKKEAVALEVSSNRVSVRTMENNKIAMTNMAVSKEMRAIDFVSKFNLNEGCPARYKRIFQILEQNHGKVDVQLAAKIMGNHIRYPINEERNNYGILAVTDNVNSMVFSPEDMNFWVASGPAPVCNNPYYGFNFNEGFNGKSSNVQPEILEGYQFKNHNKRKSMELYNKAFKIFENNPSNENQIVELLHEALKTDPSEVILSQMLAKYMIKQHNYSEGVILLEKALDHPQSLNEKAHNMLLLGILSDLLLKHKDAIHYYKNALKLSGQKVEDNWFSVNKVINAFSQKYLKKPFSKKNFKDRSILISFTQEAGIE